MSNGSTKSKCAQCAKEIPADQESLRMPIRDSVLVVCSWSCFRVLASKVDEICKIADDRARPAREAAHSAECARDRVILSLRAKLREVELEHNPRVDALTKESRRVAVEARIAKEAALDNLVDECLRRTQGDLPPAEGAQ